MRRHAFASGEEEIADNRVQASDAGKHQVFVERTFPDVRA